MELTVAFVAAPGGPRLTAAPGLAAAQAPAQRSGRPAVGPEATGTGSIGVIAASLGLLALGAARQQRQRPQRARFVLRRGENDAREVLRHMMAYGSAEHKRRVAEAISEYAKEHGPLERCSHHEAPQPSRRSMAAVLGVAAAASRGAAANAERIVMNPDVCSDCGGKGSTRCVSCNGTGKIALEGSLDKLTEVQRKMVEHECPECYGIGQVVCYKCYGTGLGEKQLRGFLRDPSFEKVLVELITGKVAIYNLPRVQQLAKQAVEDQKQRKVEEANQPSMELPLPSLPSLPSLPTPRGPPPRP